MLLVGGRVTLAPLPPPSLPKIGTLILNFRQTSWKRVVKTNRNAPVSQSVHQFVGPSIIDQTNRQNNSDIEKNYTSPKRRYIIPVHWQDGQKRPSQRTLEVIRHQGRNHKETKRKGNENRRKRKAISPKRSLSASSHPPTAQAEIFLKIPSCRTQWQYWSSREQLTEAIAGGSQVFYLIPSASASKKKQSVIGWEVLGKKVLW